jgi:DNA-binding response OmpR family regulator
MKALIVDHHLDLLDLVEYALSREGYAVVAAPDGEQALQRWASDNPDIVLLDTNLPKIDGFEVCRRIRAESSTPVIMLTACHEEDDIVRGLQMGADDYVIKPFSVKQLSARMAAVLRRYKSDSYQQPVSEVRVGDLLLDLQSHQVIRAGKPVQLTRIEFCILYMLALNQGRIIPYSRLIDYAWGYYGKASSDLLKSHISNIRKKVGLRPEGTRGIKAAFRVGYTLGHLLISRSR